MIKICFQVLTAQFDRSGQSWSNDGMDELPYYYEKSIRDLNYHVICRATNETLEIYSYQYQAMRMANLLNEAFEHGFGQALGL